MPIAARCSSTWRSSALWGSCPLCCRSGPRSRPARLPASSISVRAKIGAGTSSHAVAAAALRGVPGVRIVQADYLPESTDYGSGKDNPETRAYTAAMEKLVGDGARLVFSTSFGDDPFLLAMAKKYPDVSFRQASALASDD